MADLEKYRVKYFTTVKTLRHYKHELFIACQKLNNVFIICFARNRDYLNFLSILYILRYGHAFQGMSVPETEIAGGTEK